MNKIITIGQQFIVHTVLCYAIYLATPLYIDDGHTIPATQRITQLHKQTSTVVFYRTRVYQMQLRHGQNWHFSVGKYVHHNRETATVSYTHLTLPTIYSV